MVERKLVDEMSWHVVEVYFSEIVKAFFLGKLFFTDSMLK